jgi:type I restriction enzyme S subunit
LPPLPEQQRIADILDKANAIRRKKRQAILTLDAIKQSQFDEWFSSWFEPKAELKYVPVSQFVSRFEGGLNVATPESPAPDTRHFILTWAPPTALYYSEHNSVQLLRKLRRS